MQCPAQQKRVLAEVLHRDLLPVLQPRLIRGPVRLVDFGEISLQENKQQVAVAGHRAQAMAQFTRLAHGHPVPNRGEVHDPDMLRRKRFEIVDVEVPRRVPCLFGEEESPLVGRRAVDPAGFLLELHGLGGVSRPPEEELLRCLRVRGLLARDRLPARRGERVAGEEDLGDGAQTGQRDLSFGEGLPEDESRGGWHVVVRQRERAPSPERASQIA